MTTAPPRSTPDALTSLPLDGDGWTLRLARVHDRSRGVTHDLSDVPDGLVGRDVPATVPGCAHTDLLAAGLIDDPYLADNELRLLWTGRCDWTYARAFDAPPDLAGRRHVELCFDGLDTVATVLLNGAEVGRTRNMHRRYRLDVAGAIRPGSNDLEVRFGAPLPAMWDKQAEVGELPRAGGGRNPSQPHNMLRKMSCNTGWDWGPVVPTAGIWRGVRLEAWGDARLGDVRPAVVEATASRAVLEVAVDVAGDAADGSRVRATLRPPGGGEAVQSEIANPQSQIANLRFDVPDPQRWWPAGHGAQPLYTLRVELLGGVGGDAVLDSRECRVGLRTVALDADADADGDDFPADGLGLGSRMRLVVNGEPVYCRGADWIPDDCFPSRLTAGRVRARVAQAAGANMNMIRVWGGGLYESHDFYDACDDLGVMVWQDFTMACAAYPEDDDTAAEVEAEARDNVSRLARHPSLALWNGNNENLWGWADWKYGGKTWPEFIGGRGWGLRYYFGTFPAAVADLAPATPYWPGSPGSGRDRASFDGPGAPHPNANEHGNRHVWNVWHGPGHYLNYLGHYPRFCSEFGFHGPPCWPTVERSTPPDQRRWDSPVLRLHNKNGLSDLGDGQDKANVRMADDFDPPPPGLGEAFDDWLYLSQVVQARALSAGVGWFRCLFPYNGGSLFWQLNDCWPCPSWSAVDGDGRAKPLLHAARRFFAPRVVNLGPRRPTEGVAGWGVDPGPLRAYLHNDSPDRWPAVLRLRLMGYGGGVIAEHSRVLDVAPRSAAHIDVPDAWPRRPDAFVVAEADGGERAFWWFAPDKDAPMPAPRFTADVADGGRSVTVRAETLLRDVCLFADRLHADAAASDACVTLLPGESFTFEIDTPVPLDAAALVRPPVLRCVGDR